MHGGSTTPAYRPSPLQQSWQSTGLVYDYCSVIFTIGAGTTELAGARAVPLKLTKVGA